MERAATSARRSGLSLLPAILVLGSVALAQTLTFPALTGRVVDDAGVLDAATRESLTGKLAALEAKTTDQLVVATVKSLQGTSVEDYANRLFRHWQLGQQGKNNGVLMLVAPTERKMRVEVGYGLEGNLPDAVAKLIIENAVLPRFRANDFAGGISRGVDDLIQVLTDDSSEWKQRAAVQRPEHKSAPVNGAVLFFAIAAVVIVSVTIMNYSLPPLMRRGRRGRRNGTDYYWAPSDSGSSWSSGGSGGSGGSFDSGGFSGGGGDSGGGGASGSW
jgi:uncharacterized protein